MNTQQKTTMTRRENLLRTIRRDSPAFVPYRYDGCLTIVEPAICARPRDGGLDDWGVKWVDSGTDEGSYPDHVPAMTIEQADDMTAPATDFATLTQDLRRQVNALKDTDTLMYARNECALFERPGFLLGHAEYLMACAGYPREIQQMLDVIADYQVRLTEAIMSAGVDAVRFTDDWGMQSSLFIHPRQWRELIKPRLARIYEVVKRHGGIVFQHSCGCIGEIIPDLIELGLDVIDPCQPQSNDIFAWKREYGKSLCFMGGLDTQTYLTFGTPSEIKERVTEVLSVMSEGGGYIAAPSHTITLPEANRRAMLEALDEFNQRGQ